MADHAKFVATAQRLIDKHGRDVTLSTFSAAVTDPATPWKGISGAPATSVVKAVFVPFRGFEFGSNVTDDELLKSVDEVCLVAGSDTAFEKVDTIVDEGVSYKVEWARRLRPADRTILYAFGIMR